MCVCCSRPLSSKDRAKQSKEKEVQRLTEELTNSQVLLEQAQKALESNELQLVDLKSLVSHWISQGFQHLISAVLFHIGQEVRRSGGLCLIHGLGNSLCFIFVAFVLRYK